MKDMNETGQSGLQTVPMTMPLACEISLWKYAPPYEFYDMDEDEDSIAELMNYRAVLKDGRLYGFFCIGPWAQVPAGLALGYYPQESGAVDIGLGMIPGDTGQGGGRDFVSFVVREAVRLRKPGMLRLTVASFNLRAKKVYLQLGFRPVGSFLSGDTEFEVLEMPPI